MAPERGVQESGASLRKVGAGKTAKCLHVTPTRLQCLAITQSPQPGDDGVQTILPCETKLTWRENLYSGGTFP